MSAARTVRVESALVPHDGYSSGGLPHHALRRWPPLPTSHRVALRQRSDQAAALASTWSLGFQHLDVKRRTRASFAAVRNGVRRHDVKLDDSAQCLQSFRRRSWATAPSTANVPFKSKTCGRSPTVRARDIYRAHLTRSSRGPMHVRHRFFVGSLCQDRRQVQSLPPCHPVRSALPSAGEPFRIIGPCGPADQHTPRTRHPFGTITIQ